MNFSAQASCKYAQVNINSADATQTASGMYVAESTMQIEHKQIKNIIAATTLNAFSTARIKVLCLKLNGTDFLL
jgi:hypothetical protein